jgi:type IV pilus assembly protein PilV
MLNNRNIDYPYLSRGFSMIEVLVAVIVLSIGLLGLAGLQSVGLAHNQSASLRSTASIMAYGILDSMRANRLIADEGGYNHTLGDPAPVGTTIPEQDVGAWINELEDRLPAGTGAIDIDAAGRITITIQWDDSRGELPVQQFVMTTRL